MDLFILNNLHDLSKALKKELPEGVIVRYFDIKEFNDGEMQIFLDGDDVDDDVFIMFGIEGHAQIFQIALLINVVKKCGAKRVICFVPYFPYCRGDKAESNASLGFEVMVQFLRAVGCDEVITMNIHCDAFLQNNGVICRARSQEEAARQERCKESGEFLAQSAVYQYQGVRMINLSVLPALRYVCDDIMLCEMREDDDELDSVRLLLIAPDYGREAEVRLIAQALKLDIVFMRKERCKISGEIDMLCEEPSMISGRVCLIIDDIISTGGTIVEAARILRHNAAKSVYAFATHAIRDRGACGVGQLSGVRKLYYSDSFDVFDKGVACDAGNRADIVQSDAFKLSKAFKLSGAFELSDAFERSRVEIIVAAAREVIMAKVAQHG